MTNNENAQRAMNEARAFLAKGIEFGWGALPISEQHPILKERKTDAEHFDRDNQEIIRLHIRGLLTDSQRDAAFKKLAKKIGQTIRDILRGANQ